MVRIVHKQLHHAFCGFLLHNLPDDSHVESCWAPPFEQPTPKLLEVLSSSEVMHVQSSLRFVVVPNRRGYCTRHQQLVDDERVSTCSCSAFCPIGKCLQTQRASRVMSFLPTTTNRDIACSYVPIPGLQLPFG